MITYICVCVCKIHIISIIIEKARVFLAFILKSQFLLLNFLASDKFLLGQSSKDKVKCVS